MKSKRSTPRPGGEGPYPMAKLFLGVFIVLVVFIVASWLLDKFQIWRWFR